MADVREAQRHTLSRSTQAEGVMLKALPGRRFTARLVALLILLFCLCQPKTDGLPLLLSFSGIASAGELSAYDQAYAAFESDRYNDAIRYAREALARASDTSARIDAEELLLYAFRWERGVESALLEANRLRSEAMRAHPVRSEELEYLIGMVGTFRDEHEDAGEVRTQIEALGSGGLPDPESELCLARLLYLDGGRQSAVQVFDALRRKHPSKSVGLKAAVTLSALYTASGDAVKARRVFSESVSKPRNADLDAEAIAALASIYTAQKSFEAGVQRLRDMASERPHAIRSAVGASMAYQVGNLRMAAGDTKGAVTAFREAVRRDPTSRYATPAVENIAVALKGSDSAAAAFEMERIISEYPDTQAALTTRYQLSAILQEKGDLEGAENLMLDIMGRNPDSPEAALVRETLVQKYMTRADEQNRMGNIEGAVSYWTKACTFAQGEKLVFAVCVTASALNASGRYDEVHSLIQPLLKSSLVSEFREELEYLDAMAYFNSADYAFALRIIERIAATTRSTENRATMQLLIAEIQSRMDQ